MGLAKYYEDNIEIICDRMYMREHSYRPTPVKVTVTILPSIIKAEKKQNKKVYEDKYIVCKDCGRKFLFSAKSQKYFDAKGWNDPKRCKECRDFRNARYLMCSSYKVGA